MKLVLLIGSNDRAFLFWSQCENADKGDPEIGTEFPGSVSQIFYMRVVVSKSAGCQFFFSKNGKDFTSVGPKFTAKPGRWVGAKIGMFCRRENITNDADFGRCRLV